MVVGNNLRLLMICKCSSGGSCMREGIFVLVCLGLQWRRWQFGLDDIEVENFC